MKPDDARKPGLAEFLVLGATAAAQIAVIWLSLPPQQRYWIRLAVLGKLRAATARLAWLEGRAGMAEEIQTERKSVRYLSALGLSLLREYADQTLEDMRL